MLTLNDVLDIIYWHTDYKEVGEIEYSEWTAKLIQTAGFTVAALKAYMRLINYNEDPSVLDRIKTNFPQYNI